MRVPRKPPEAGNDAEKIAPTPIRVVKQSPPAYPALARQLKLAGAVTLQVTVESDGTVSKVDVVDGNPMLANGCGERREAMGLPTGHGPWTTGAVQDLGGGPLRGALTVGPVDAGRNGRHTEWYVACSQTP